VRPTNEMACLVGKKEKKKEFAQYLSHRIFEHMHRALNIGKK
jgi:hypothetical protein